MLFHASVNAWVYSRVAETGAWKRPPGVSGLAHASWVLALLPAVVWVDVPPTVRVSHGPGAETLRRGPVGVAPGAGDQQPTTSWPASSGRPSEVRLGLAVK